MYHLYIASCVAGGGIYHYYLKDGRLQFREKTTCDRPTYLNVAGDTMEVLLRQPFEGSRASGLAAYPLLRDGSLGPQKSLISTKGEVACHLCSWQGKTYVANYSSGSVFSSDGNLRAHFGVGVHPVRQEASHLHFVSQAPDNRCLLAVDLGLDAIYSYDEDLNLLSVAHVPAGCGPRHLAYAGDGRTVLCVNELDSSVTVFDYSDCRLTRRETVPLLEERNKDNISAAIRVQGRYVYVSNRGDDSISCLEWDGEHLKLCSVTPCGGAFPRDFLLVEGRLFCANERSGSVTIFRADGPVLTMEKERLLIPAPLCVACGESGAAAS